MWSEVCDQRYVIRVPTNPLSVLWRQQLSMWCSMVYICCSEVSNSPVPNSTSTIMTVCKLSVSAWSWCYLLSDRDFQVAQPVPAPATPIHTCYLQYSLACPQKWGVQTLLQRQRINGTRNNSSRLIGVCIGKFGFPYLEKNGINGKLYWNITQSLHHLGYTSG